MALKLLLILLYHLLLVEHLDALQIVVHACHRSSVGKAGVLVRCHELIGRKRLEAIDLHRATNTILHGHGRLTNRSTDAYDGASVGSDHSCRWWKRRGRGGWMIDAI